MKNYFLGLLVLGMLSIFPSALWGNLLVSVDGVESKTNTGTVVFSLVNKSEQAVKAARAWIFIFDEKGKVVGSHAEWIIGEKENAQSFSAGGKQTFTSQVPTKGNVATAQVTFSRIVMEDGSLPNPVQFVKPAVKKKDS